MNKNTVQTNPPLDVLMKAAHGTEPKRHPLTYYKEVIAVLVLDKGLIATEVKQWLESHGAGVYKIAAVSPLVTAVRKERKEAEEKSNDQPQS